MFKTNESLISRIYMEFLKVSKKKKVVPMGKPAKVISKRESSKS